MKKVFCVILIVAMILVANTAAYAVYEEEDEVENISYELVLALHELGMKPNLTIDEDGMVWTTECTLSEMNERFDDEDGLNGDAMVYVWYDVYNNIGSMTVAGEISDPDSDEVIHFMQIVIYWDDDYEEFCGKDDLERCQIVW